MAFYRPASWQKPLSLLLLCAALALPSTLAAFGQEFYIGFATRVLIFALAASSLNLVLGFGGMVSLGHAAFLGAGAYAAAICQQAGINEALLVFPAAMGIAGLFALVIGFFVVRTRGIYFIMVTLAFAQMAYFIFHDTPLGGGSDGMYLNTKPSAAIFGWEPFELSNEVHLFYFILATLVLVYLFLGRVLQSPFGRVLVGIKSNEHRMQSLGYFTFRYKLGAFTLAGALGGLAGFLYTVLFGFVTPELLSWHESGNVLLMVILGGMGNLVGAIAGAFAFEAMREVFADLTKYWQLLMGGVIVAVVLFLPGGLAGIPGRIKRALQGGEAK